MLYFIGVQKKGEMFMYSFDSRVRYSETSKDGMLGLCAMVHYMQDCSIFQSEALGVGVEVLKEERRAWLLSSWQIEVDRRPKLGEYLKIGTWAYGFKAMYGYRNFVILDESGSCAVRANSIWTYMNLETGRPERVSDELASVYQPEKPLDMENEGRKIQLPESMGTVAEFPVQKYQIDTNGHVNNGQYIQMASEWLPEDGQIKKLRVEYKRAAVYGDRILVQSGEDDRGITVALKSSENVIYAVIQAVPR